MRRRGARKSSGRCDVPGCGQAIRFVEITRDSRKLGRAVQRWVAVNVRPVAAGEEDAEFAGIFVSVNGAAADIPAADRADLMTKAPLFVEHRLTCLDPNWHRLHRAASEIRPTKV